MPDKLSVGSSDIRLYARVNAELDLRLQVNLIALTDPFQKLQIFFFFQINQPTRCINLSDLLLVV